ncbi:hypothetical protein CMUS01_16039 [Colletotrichum musicola]|uniref:Uncharacterized protein n=1 Tax=Colletotrichum musicola TaxID=2175873 RepID=A0A8H6IS95_9PEZI|nr:hypothetical protein CMUS01_16039 [Colletotrichum musicola]
MAPKETSTSNIDRRSALRNAFHRLVNLTEQPQELITQAWENLREKYHDYAIAEEEEDTPEYAEYFPIWTLSHLTHLKLRLILETVYGGHWKAELYLFFGPLVVKSRHCWSSLPDNPDTRDILAHLARNRDNRAPLTHYTVREFTTACTQTTVTQRGIRTTTESRNLPTEYDVPSQPGGMGAGNSRPEHSEMGDRDEDRDGGSDEHISHSAAPPPSIIAQLGTADGDEPSVNIATWAGRRFAVADDIAKKGYRGRLSWITVYGLFINEL